MTVKKTQSQIIIDAVAAMAIAMMENVNVDIEMESSVVGMSPALLLKNEAGERLAWIAIHASYGCPQVWLANLNECGYCNSPVMDHIDSESGPQIFSPIFGDENQEEGCVRGYNLSNERFYDQVSEGAKYVVRWLIEGRR